MKLSILNYVLQRNNVGGLPSVNTLSPIMNGIQFAQGMNPGIL